MAQFQDMGYVEKHIPVTMTISHEMPKKVDIPMIFPSKHPLQGIAPLRLFTPILSHHLAQLFKKLFTQKLRLNSSTFCFYQLGILSQNYPELNFFNPHVCCLNPPSLRDFLHPFLGKKTT